jgi:endonuclease-3
MHSQKAKRQQADLLTQAAVRKHGELKGRKPRPPLDQLVLSLFYHLTSVRRATRALRQIKQAFVDWNEVRISHPVEVARVLSSAHWARVGAEQLQCVLRGLNEAHHRTDLEFLKELTPAQARSCLKSLPSVSRDVADEVLLLSLDVPALPLSADAARMCHRLGMLDDDRPTIRNRRALERLIAPDHYVTLHLLFCDCAEAVCLPEEPRCKQCPMLKSCPSARTRASRSRSRPRRRT